MVSYKLERLVDIYGQEYDQLYWEVGEVEWLNKIILGDCLTVLKQMPNQCVHTCVTSPPYWGLRDYGVDGQLGLEPTPEEYVQRMVEVFREVRRMLRDDGTLWLNLGDSYVSRPQNSDDKWIDPANPRKGGKRCRTNVNELKPKDLVGIPWRVALALQADGWYLRSDIIWHKPNPMPESVTDRPTKAHEYIFLLSKSERYYYDHEAIKEPGVQDEWANGFRGGAYTEGKTFDNSEGGKRTKQGNFKVPSGWDTESGAHGSIHRTGRSR
jgi:DNA modification methylase